MGRGNYHFRQDGEWIKTYHVDLTDDVSEEEPLEVHDFLYEDFKESVRSVKGLDHAERWADRDELVIAENGILEVRIADNEWSMAIACVPKRNEHDRINPMYTRSADRVMKAIGKMYKNCMHVATSAWTSGKITDPANYSYY